jgi:large subunit ribosomal protein L32e
MTAADERKRLMKLRKKMSQRRPKFAQFESWRYVRIKDHWRQPKGIDNHMRQNRKGWPRSVNIGYGSPKSVRGLHPSGMEEVAVYNLGDLAIIDPETQVARVGGSVGARKRSNIVAEAEKQGIKVLNPGIIRDTLGLEEIYSGEEEVDEGEEGIEEVEAEEGIEKTDDEVEGVEQEPHEPKAEEKEEE